MPSDAVEPPFISRVDHALAMAERRIPTPSRYAAEWALEVLAAEKCADLRRPAMADEAPSISPAVEAMVDDSRAPTAPLNDFLDAMRQDDNWWWRIGCGHHLNLFEEAVEKMDPLHRRWYDEEP